MKRLFLTKEIDSVPRPVSEPLILRILREKDYEVFDDRQINLIGVRSSESVANRFDDEIHLIWNDGIWHHVTYSVTCDPGTYWLESPTNVDGTAILMPGQYKNTYKFDLHAGRYSTLCQRGGVVRVWRDANKDNTLDHDDNIDEGWFGINIHHAGEDSPQVEKWSAGCQVFKKLEDWKEAMKICKDSGAEWFTYTLINDKDLDS